MQYSWEHGIVGTNIRIIGIWVSRGLNRGPLASKARIEKKSAKQITKTYKLEHYCYQLLTVIFMYWTVITVGHHGTSLAQNEIYTKWPLSLKCCAKNFMVEDNGRFSGVFSGVKLKGKPADKLPSNKRELDSWVAFLRVVFKESSLFQVDFSIWLKDFNKAERQE